MNVSCPTLDSLIELGFERWQGQRRTRNSGDGADVRLFGMHGLREPAPGTDAVVYPFSNFDLFCTRTMNRFATLAVRIHGVINTGTEITEIDSEIPGNLESPLEAAAWVSYAIKSDKRDLGPLPDWFVKGEENWELIPFVAEQRAYRARPHCDIDRDYARPLRRKLQEEILWLEGEAEMTLSFDGRVLSINFDGRVHEVVARGDRWSSSFRVLASPETKLPARFKRTRVDVSVFNGYLSFGGLRLGQCEAVS